MRHGRRDKTHHSIVTTLRKMGCPTFDTSDLGKGFVDCITRISGRVWLIECKDGSKPPSQRKLTPLEEKFHSEWAGNVVILNSIEETIDFVNDLRNA